MLDCPRIYKEIADFGIQYGLVTKTQPRTSMMRFLQRGEGALLNDGAPGDSGVWLGDFFCCGVRNKSQNNNLSKSAIPLL
jgi:hypothetical protein